jgi:branched-chain amino acid aminotransferase
MVVISETVKITRVTCETEVTNKVTTLDCSESPSEAGRKMGEETEDGDCNQTGINASETVIHNEAATEDICT